MTEALTDASGSIASSNLPLDGAVLVVALCCSLFVSSRLLDRLGG